MEKGMIGFLFLMFVIFALTCAAITIHKEFKQEKQDLPTWAYGLECEIDEMSFISPEAHYEYAKEHGTLLNHTDKIPVVIK